MKLFFNTKHKNAIAKIGDSYYFLSNQPKKLVFNDTNHQAKVEHYLSPLKAMPEESFFSDETLTKQEWNNIPKLLAKESDDPEGYVFGDIKLRIEGGTIYGNTQSYIINGIVKLCKELNK